MRRCQIRQAADPARSWPHQDDDANPQPAHRQARNGRGAGTNGGASVVAHPRREQAFGEMPKSFAKRDIDGLHGQGVQRPKAVLGEPQEWPAHEPGDRHQGQQQQRRQDLGVDVGGLGETEAIQIETSSGAAPSSRPGKPISSIQAITSFGRLISASRLPINDSSDRRLVLAASSSMSPFRGSRIGVIVSPSGANGDPSVPCGGGRPEELRHPAARRVLVADGQDCDHDRDADERAGQSPQKGPEEDSEQHHERRHGKMLPAIRGSR